MQAKPAWFQDSGNLAERRRVISNMLEDLFGEDKVERPVIEGNTIFLILGDQTKKIILCVEFDIDSKRSN